MSATVDSKDLARDEIVADQMENGFGNNFHSANPLQWGSRCQPFGVPVFGTRRGQDDSEGNCVHANTGGELRSSDASTLP